MLASMQYAGINGEQYCNCAGGFSGNMKQCEL